MLRVFLTFAVLACASTAPFTGAGLQGLLPSQQGSLRSDPQQWNRVNTVQDDDSQTVDNMGAGYSFFRKQQVDLQPFSQAPSPMLKQDLSEYMFSSALEPNTPQQQQQQQQQPSNTNINQLVREPFQRQQQQQQLAFDQMQQNNFQPALTQQQRNIFGQLAPQDAETWSPQQQQQILIPQTSLNRQNQNFGGFASQQQQDRGIAALPQKTWNNQINPASFASAFGNRGQQQQQMLSPQFLQALAGQRQLQQVAPTGRVNGGW